MDHTLKNYLEKLEQLAQQLRFAGLTSLGLTVGNLLILALLFAIFFFNQRIFKTVSSPYSLSVQELQKDLGAIFFVSSIVFASCLGVLYWFDQVRKRLHVIADQVFDEVGWYGQKGSSGAQAKIGLDERIALKTASENSNLPFLSESQGVALYVLINFILFVAVAALDLYLIQALNSAVAA